MFCISLSEYVCIKTCSFLVPPSRDEINKSETVSGAPRMYIVFSPVYPSLPINGSKSFLKPFYQNFGDILLV